VKVRYLTLPSIADGRVKLQRLFSTEQTSN
jgi:hypothetical protein